MAPEREWSWRPLFDEYKVGRRCEPVGAHFHNAETRLERRRYVEVGGHFFVGGHCHAAMVMSTAVRHMGSCEIRDPHQWIIGRGLHVVAEGSSLGDPIESDSGNLIGMPPRNL